MDYFKDFDKIKRLTDRQKAEIIGHKRDKNGHIVFPTEDNLPYKRRNHSSNDSSTLEDDLAAADFVAAICAANRTGVDVDKVRKEMAEAMKARILERHAQATKDKL